MYKYILIISLAFIGCSHTESEMTSDSSEIEQNVMIRMITDLRSDPTQEPIDILTKYVYDYEEILKDSLVLNSYLKEISALGHYAINMDSSKFNLLSGDELESSQFKFYQPRYTRDSICDECVIYYMIDNPEERINICVRNGKVFSFVGIWDFENEGMVWY